MPAFDHFGKIAGVYDRVASGEINQRWNQLLELPVEGWLLDAGGGTGRLSRPFCSEKLRVVVADVSWGMLRQATRKPCLYPALGEAESLPFGDSTFDRIMMSDALHHVRDQQQTAREFLRVLKPGGRIVIAEPNIRRGLVKLIAVAEKMLLMRSHIISVEKIAGLFGGFTADIQTYVDGYQVWVIIRKT